MKAHQPSIDTSLGILAYTDGSYGRGPGGWSWVAVGAGEEYLFGSGSVPPPTTNNRMEMLAQVRALQELYEILGPCEIQIVSDSKYVVLGCQDPSRARNVNVDIWDELDAAVKLHNHVEWRHVRGHVGIKWNELADVLAVEARRNADLSSYPVT